MFKDLVARARSFRRYDNNYQIDDAVMEDLIDTARITPSAANRQSIRYFYSTSAETNDLIFPHLNWAGYLDDWAGPEVAERPSGYIILIAETVFVPYLSFDIGIIGQTIQLAASEKGLGTCMIASVDKNKLKKAIQLESDFEIVLVIALGKPIEKVVLTEVGEDGSIKYWRDEDGVHYVPKRNLRDIIIQKSRLMNPKYLPT